MNKWLLRTTLGVFLLSQFHATAVSAQVTEKLFSDIDQASNWSLASIAYLNELGITQGYDNGTYQPRKKLLVKRWLNCLYGLSSYRPMNLHPCCLRMFVQAVGLQTASNEFRAKD